MLAIIDVRTLGQISLRVVALLKLRTATLTSNFSKKHGRSTDQFKIKYESFLPESFFMLLIRSTKIISTFDEIIKRVTFKIKLKPAFREFFKKQQKMFISLQRIRQVKDLRNDYNCINMQILIIFL